MTDLSSMVELAQAWANLGGAISEQAETLVQAYRDDADLDEVCCTLNGNAIGYVMGWLERVWTLADGDVADEARELLVQLQGLGYTERTW